MAGRVSVVICLVLVLLAGSVARTAAVGVVKDGAGFRVHTATYDAAVGADGSLTSLIVDGTELLCDPVRLAGGADPFRNRVARTVALRQVDGRTVVATSDGVSARYAFGEDLIRVDVDNRTAEPVPFYAVFEPAVVGVSDGHGGPVVATAAAADVESAVLFTGAVAVRTGGGTHVWGPWLDRQVWEAAVPAGGSRAVSFAVGPLAAAETTAVAALPPRPWEPGQPVVERDVMIVSPQEYQVVQRQSAAGGRVRFSGRVTVPACDRIEVRVTGTAGDGTPVQGEWRAVPYEPLTRTFDGELAVPAGGWYGVKVRATAGGRGGGSATLAHVGVGEVFVGAGQSNSTNCGQERAAQRSGLVAAFSGTRWQLANDPQPGTHDHYAGGSFWPAFGDAMVARYHVPIGVAVTGHAATNLKQWAPGGELFNWTLGRLRQLGPGGCRAVLWHQGESDWGTPADAYADRLGQLILSTQRAAGWECPWFVARASYHDAGHPRDEAVRRGQQLVLDRHLAVEGPDTDLLTGDNRDNGGTGVHFSPKGLAAHGAAWAEKVGAYLDAVLK